MYTFKFSDNFTGTKSYKEQERAWPFRSPEKLLWLIINEN